MQERPELSRQFLITNPKNEWKYTKKTLYNSIITLKSWKQFVSQMINIVFNVFLKKEQFKTGPFYH